MKCQAETKLIQHQEKTHDLDHESQRWPSTNPENPFKKKLERTRQQTNSNQPYYKEPKYEQQYIKAIDQLPFNSAFKSKLYDLFDLDLPFDQDHFTYAAYLFAKQYQHSGSRLFKP